MVHGSPGTRARRDVGGVGGWASTLPDTLMRALQGRELRKVCFVCRRRALLRLCSGRAWTGGLASPFGQSGLAPLGSPSIWRELAVRMARRYQPAMESCVSGKIPFARLDGSIAMLEAPRGRASSWKAFPRGAAATVLAWHRLDAWRDVSRGSRSARANSPRSGLQRQPLADGGPSRALTRFRGTRSSARDRGPDYTEAARLPRPPPEALRSDPGECMMVAAHSYDLSAPAASGCGTAHVSRRGNTGRAPGDALLRRGGFRGELARASRRAVARAIRTPAVFARPRGSGVEIQTPVLMTPPPMPTTLPQTSTRPAHRPHPADTTRQGPSFVGW